MKPERYKVKSIDEVAGNLAIISPFNKADEMIFLDEISQNQAIKIMDNYLKADLELVKSRHNFIISKKYQAVFKRYF